MSVDASYRFGIEKEYFLADVVKRDTPRHTVKVFHAGICRSMPLAERELPGCGYG